MTSYDDRPWLPAYDAWVDPDLPVPEGSYVDLMEATFRDFPDHLACRFMGCQLSFRELDEATARFASFLWAAGCVKGDVVGISLPNTPQHMIAHFGTIRAGCAALGLSPLLAPRELAHQIVDAKARVIVLSDVAFEEKLFPVRSDIDGVSHVVVTGIGDYLPFLTRHIAKLLGKIPGGRVRALEGKTTVTLKRALQAHAPGRSPGDLLPTDTCLVQYTGGTTGLPKGTVLTHRNMVSNVSQVGNWFDEQHGTGVYISAFPFFHAAGLITCMTAVAYGATQVLIPDPRNTDHICKEIARHPPTIMGNVPSLCQMLLRNPRFAGLDFSATRCCISGAAPFPVEAMRAFEAVVGVGKVVEVYGMTESSPMLTMNPLGSPRPGSVGVPIQGVRLKLVDLEGGTTAVPIGEIGQIIARGPQVMKEYLGKPEETANTLRTFEGETWLYTGDVGRMEPDGFVYLVDRAKDMLIVGGFKVFSREVEEHLYELPVVMYCAIVGLPNPERPGNEIVKLVVQLTDEARAQDPDRIKEDILSYCREHMSPYKVPKIVEFVDAMPLTPIGKVDKKPLRTS